MPDEVKIFVDGHVDDLYALALLFPEGAYPGLHVVTELKGRKDGMLDRVDDAESRSTYVTGEGCLPLFENTHFQYGRWIAQEILSPLNGYAALSDANFSPVVPVSASYKSNAATGNMIFRDETPNRPTRLITVNKSPSIHELLRDRVNLMADDPLAAYAANVMSAEPSWADYYRLLEDIAGRLGSSLDKLDATGVAERQPLNAFKRGANNRTFGRHGASKRSAGIDQSELMNLLEAREFVRRVVSAWFDLVCGGYLPRDRVDGPPLRFGLDQHD